MKKALPARIKMKTALSNFQSRTTMPIFGYIHLTCTAILVLSGFLAVFPSKAEALFVPEDLIQMVQGADRVIKGRVIRGANLDSPGPNVALLKVLEHFTDHTEKEVEVILEGTTANPTGYAFHLGETCFLCLRRYPEDSRYFQEINFGHSKFSAKDGLISKMDVEIPGRIRFLLPDNKVATFAKALVWIRGPCIEVKDEKEVHRFDQVIDLWVTLKNVSQVPMTLPADTGLALGRRFFVTLVDDAGFSVSEGVWCGEDQMEVEYEKTSKNKTVVLKPGESLKGRIRIPLRKSVFIQDPERATEIKLSYFHCPSSDAAGNVWTGSSTCRIPIRISCTFRNWVKNFRRPNGQWSVSMQLPAVSSPKETVLAELDFTRADQLEHGGSGINGVSKEEKELLSELRKCFQVEWGNSVSLEANPNRTAILNLLKSRDNFFCRFNLSDLCDLSKPGNYRIRFQLPGSGRESLSRVVKLVVVDK